MTIRRILLVLLFIALGKTSIVFSQTDSLSKVSSEETDTTRLGFEDFMRIVKKHHPVSTQADIQINQADAQLLMSRGAFDPKLLSNFSRKNFDEKEYYNLINAGVKIPTWFGVELYGGVEKNQGQNLNPENITTDNGLWYAGISVPIGKNLIIDKRRAELRKAQIYQEASLVQRNIMLNEILLEAGQAYWEWFKAYHVLKVYEEAVNLAQDRFNAVMQNATIGEVPLVDTLEAGIQVQNRELGFQEAQLEFKNASVRLSIYLWAEGVVPLELNDNTLPPKLELIPALSADTDYVTLLDTLPQIHPELQKMQFTVEQLKIERRYNRDQLKPELDLKYNFLNDLIGANDLNAYSLNNYKVGIDFSFPLFIRKERGALRTTNLQLDATETIIADKQANINYKARTALNEWSTTKSQHELYQRTVRDYQNLLRSERTLFFAGESSLFLVNSREMGFINAQTKLIELLTKNRKAILKTSFAFGRLHELF